MIETFRRATFLVVAVVMIHCMPLSAWAVTESAEALYLPWSGWWWPTMYGGLATGAEYRGHPAPLEKYDLLTTGSYPGSATQWYLDNYYNPDALVWEGLCASWATASVSENYEFYPSVIDKVVLYVGDKKGLMTMAHLNDPSIRVGSHDPQVFHSWLLTYIRDQGLAFSAELDPGPEVWNFPVYRYEMDTIDSGTSMQVTCTIWYAIDQVHPDIQETISKTKTYTYTLTKSQDGTITGGEWTGSSVDNHPQQLRLPLAPGNTNPYIDYDLVRSWAQSKDDELESDDVTDLAPGGYTLLLLNDDSYLIDCSVGDTMHFHLRLDEQASYAIQCVLRDADGAVATQTTLDEEEVSFSFQAQNPPYTLTLTSEEYSPAGSLYYMDFDLTMPFEFVNTKLQKGFGWGGFAVTNSGDGTCGKVYVTGYGRSGRPLDTFAGPFSLAPGEKRTFVVADFDVKAVDRDELTGVKVLAASELDVVNLFGYSGKNMSALVPSSASSRLVIPDSTSSWEYARSVNWGIYNNSEDEQYAFLKLFTSAGELKSSVVESVAADGYANFSASDSPFTANVSGGWILVDADNGELKGYTEWIESGVIKAESMPALQPGRDFFVPHLVAGSSFWSQELVLIEVTGAASEVTLSLANQAIVASAKVTLQPYEKQTVSLPTLFAGVDQSVINSSALLLEGGSDYAGYVRFVTAKDNLYYPLLATTDLRRDLILAHVAANDYWWSACTLGNPTSAAVEVSVVPYDNSGNALETLAVARHLPPLSKDIFDVAALFGPASEEFSFVRIEVTHGEGVAGLFGIGNTDCSMLSGGVLQ